MLTLHNLTDYTTVSAYAGPVLKLLGESCDLQGDGDSINLEPVYNQLVGYIQGSDFRTLHPLVLALSCCRTRVNHIRNVDNVSLYTDKKDWRWSLTNIPFVTFYGTLMVAFRLEGHDIEVDSEELDSMLDKLILAHEQLVHADKLFRVSESALLFMKSEKGRDTIKSISANKVRHSLTAKLQEQS